MGVGERGRGGAYRGELCGESSPSSRRSGGGLPFLSDSGVAPVLAPAVSLTFAA